jgi:two-component system sensor histidine kinase DesK
LAYVTVVAFALPEAARGPALIVACLSISLAAGILPDNRLALMVVLASAVGAALHDFRVVPVVNAVFVAVVFLGTGRASMWMFDIVRQLDQARRAQSEMAVMEERLRFSRDVHDVLGRRLSMIAVQAELAATLAQRGDVRAPEKMLEVRGVAHQALREARELARGYRPTSFPQEVEGARALLRSAGIDVQVRVETMPHGWHEAAGWVVREAVTNVLRHSDASAVEITFAAGRLEITNDGARPETSVDGAGIGGLRERLLPLGAALDAGPRDGAGWSVIAELPGAGPLSAKAMQSDDA